METRPRGLSCFQIYLKAIATATVHGKRGGVTFMMKKRRRMTNTLTLGCSHAAERPRPGGKEVPEILVQVKLSNRELIHSLGISCQKEKEKNGFSSLGYVVV